MTEQIPTPTPEQVQQWLNHLAGDTRRRTLTTDDFLLAACAAEWGANQELEACCEWLKAKEWIHPEFSDELRAARRPEPPSLKAQALALIDECTDPHGDYLDDNALTIIRRAIEALPDN